MQFDSPFLVVYIGTSLFSVFLPIRVCYERLWGRLCHCCCSDEEVVILPWRNDGELTEASALQRHGGVRDTQVEGGRTLLPSSCERNSHQYDDIDHHHHDDDSFDPAFDNESSFQTNNSHHYEPSSDPMYLYSHQDHVSMAMKVAPLWFTSNYFYAVSLKWTTIASSTVLASMGSLFAFGFATCSKYGDEQISTAKLCGVLLCFMGGVATTYMDVTNNSSDSSLTWDTYNGSRYLRHSAIQSATMGNPSSLWGDLSGLLSAIGYGAYTVLLRHLCPQDETRMSMQLLFGYIGLLNMMSLLPIALWVVLMYPQNNGQAADSNMHSDDDIASTHSTITWSVFLFIILKGLLDNVLSDYLWARAVILTSATVASVSVGLTIPMAFAADIIMGNDNTHEKGQIIGAALVLIGFVFVNVDGAGKKRNEEEPEDGEIEFENNGGLTRQIHDVDIVL